MQKPIYVKKQSFTKIGSFPISSSDYDKISLDNLLMLNGTENSVGVCFYKDLQNFFKRLRINLSRRFQYEGDFSFYACSEYGETSGRPHFHVLLFIPSFQEALFRTACVESWPYADWSKLRRGIEVAKDMSNYCASYVNRSSDFPTQPK